MHSNFIHFHEKIALENVLRSFVSVSDHFRTVLVSFIARYTRTSEFLTKVSTTACNKRNWWLRSLNRNYLILVVRNIVLIAYVYIIELSKWLDIYTWQKKKKAILYVTYHLTNGERHDRYYSSQIFVYFNYLWKKGSLAVAFIFKYLIPQNFSIFLFHKSVLRTILVLETDLRSHLVYNFGT